MNFEKYYAAVIRTRTQTEPSADEAKRDFQAMNLAAFVIGSAI